MQDIVEITRSYVSLSASQHDEIRAVILGSTDSTANHATIGQEVGDNTGVRIEPM
jgi:hypothetical protein